MLKYGLSESLSMHNLNNTKINKINNSIHSLSSTLNTILNTLPNTLLNTLPNTILNTLPNALLNTLPNTLIFPPSRSPPSSPEAPQHNKLDKPDSLSQRVIDRLQKHSSKYKQ